MSVQSAISGGIERRRAGRAWSFGLWTVLSFGLAYGLLHAALRLALSPNLTEDDATANILAQTLEPSYVIRQPPLYEWLLWYVQRLTGPTLPSFLLIKYGLLTATFGILYAASTRIFSDARWRVLAALSPLFIYQIGWNLHEGVTQTLVLVFAVAVSFVAFMRLSERDGMAGYLLFGAAVGLGLISKYSFLTFVVALLGSAVLQPHLRARIVDWRMLLAAAAALLVSSPALYWLWAGKHDLVALYREVVAPAANTDRLRATLLGLARAIYVPLGFLFPLDAAIALLFPRAFAQAWAELRLAFSWRELQQDRRRVDWVLLLTHMTIAGFLILIAGALATGATHYIERYMHPMFLLTPLLLLALVERTGNAERKVKILGVLLAAFVLAVLPLRLHELFGALGPACQKCRVAIPYARLADALKQQGFQQGTIVAQTRNDAGNLRRFFPEARIVCLERPGYAPPRRPYAVAHQVAVVLAAEGRRGLLLYANEQVGALGGTWLSVVPIKVSWQPLPSSAPPREWSWRVGVENLPGAVEEKPQE